MPKKALLWLCLVAVPTVMAGCAVDNRLISRGFDKTLTTDWVTFAPPRAADQPVEYAVLEAARDFSRVPLVGLDVMYVHQEDAARIVAVVEQLGEGSDLFSEKHVTRYKVVDGKIAAKSPTTEEIFPDVEFERAVIITAKRAASTDPVMLYESGANSVTMASRPLGKCAAMVKIYDPDSGRRTPRAVKKVRLCY